jgi:hypothetical protein
MNSNFKVHPTFTNYAVSRDGEVYSFFRDRKLTLQPDGNGYLKVTLVKDKKAHTRLVNRLVLETYDPIENAHLYHAHHENRIRNDNRLENLEWELKADHLREHKQNVSEETRKRMSEAQKGKVVSEETRRKLSEASKGRVHTEEARRKISEANKGNQWNVGKVRSEETKKKMGEAQKGMLYWNNGTKTIRSKVCPGDGWVRGRIM